MSQAFKAVFTPPSFFPKDLDGVVVRWPDLPPTPFVWRAKPCELAPALAVNFVRNKKPVPITYSRFRKAGGVA